MHKNNKPKEYLEMKVKLFKEYIGYSKRQQKLIEEEAWDRLNNLGDTKHILREKIDHVDNVARQEKIVIAEITEADELKKELEALMREATELDKENLVQMGLKKNSLLKAMKDFQVQKKAHLSYVTDARIKNEGNRFDAKR